VQYSYKFVLNDATQFNELKVKHMNCSPKFDVKPKNKKISNNDIQIKYPCRARKN
jgi:hypothetical protein